jgi:hypothetical protein
MLDSSPILVSDPAMASRVVRRPLQALFAACLPADVLAGEVALILYPS